MRIENVMEATGIDLIPYAIGLSKFTSKPSFEPVKLSDIRKKIHSLDSKKLDEALEYSKELLDEESVRGEKAESKASNLIGVTGISAAFITGISSLFPKETSFASPIPIILVLFFYILIVVSLTLTVLLASRAVTVRSYARPDMADVFQMRSKPLKAAKLDRLAAYVYCYGKNCQTHDIKVSYLMGAQLWFRNSIVVFLILAFTLIFSFLGANTSSAIAITGTPIPPTITQTVDLFTSINPPTNTLQPTATITSPAPSASPIPYPSTTVTP